MPFSDFMPGLVLPDTREARDAAYKTIIPQNPELDGWVYFCRDWKPDRNNKQKCINADHSGDIRHNLCFKCPAGYAIVDLSNRERMRHRVGLTVTGLEP